MPIWTDALIGDTTHLSAEEFGAYLLILIATWRNNGVPFPDDDERLARICRISKARWGHKMRPALAAFFDLSGGSWRQKRLEKEWNFVAEKRAKNVEAGRASADTKALKRQKTESTDVAATLQPNGQRNGQRNGNPHTHTYKGTEDPDGSSAEIAPFDAKTVVINRCIAWMAKTTHQPEKSFRAWVVKLLREYGDGAVVEAFTAASRAPPFEPKSWIEGTLRHGRANGKRTDPITGWYAGFNAVLAERDGGRGSPDREPDRPADGPLLGGGHAH